MLKPAFIGVDLAFAKGKRLPVVLCTWENGRLVPAALRALPYEPPTGSGNAKVLDRKVVRQFADDTIVYIRAVCNQLGVYPKCIGIDAPSGPRPEHVTRRSAEASVNSAGIHCFATPSESEFDQILIKVQQHLGSGGPENRIPHANQLWMVVGFELFRRLAQVAPCIEVFPQATVRLLGAGQQHKSKTGAVKAQLLAASVHTGWPSTKDKAFADIAFAPAHDRLDAYLSAWVAALEPEDRIAFGDPPDDVIWAPRIDLGSLNPQPVDFSKRMPQPDEKLIDSSNHRRVCPACGEFEFKRWPFGWDAHAAYKCTGLEGPDPDLRKSEFRATYLNAAKKIKSSITISIEWGYDKHAINITSKDWKMIKAGQPLEIAGDGYDYEGEFFQDCWAFNKECEGSLVVTYGDDGAVGFNGMLNDAERIEGDSV